MEAIIRLSTCDDKKADIIRLKIQILEVNCFLSGRKMRHFRIKDKSLDNDK